MADEIIAPTPTPEPSVPPVETTPSDSTIFGVSVRAWLVVMLVTCVCAMQLLGMVLGYLATGDLVIEIREPLYSLTIAGFSYYFGQSTRKVSI